MQVCHIFVSSFFSSIIRDKYMLLRNELHSLFDAHKNDIKMGKKIPVVSFLRNCKFCLKNNCFKKVLLDKRL